MLNQQLLSLLTYSLLMAFLIKKERVLFYFLWRSFNSLGKFFQRTFSEYRSLKFLCLLQFISGEISTIHRDQCGKLFYFDLWSSILRWSNLYGIQLLPLRRSLRKEIWKERRFENRVKGEIIVVLLQMLMIYLLTLMLLLLTQSMVDKKNGISIFLLSFWEIGAIFLFLIHQKKMKDKIFSHYGELFHSLYALKILSRTEIPLPLLWQESGLHQLDYSKKSQDKFLKSIEHVYFLMRILGERGDAIDEELEEVIDDIWCIKEEDEESFLKQLNSMRILYLVIFFVLPYMGFTFFFFTSQLDISGHL